MEQGRETSFDTKIADKSIEWFEDQLVRKLTKVGSA
jgi:hypothetical protein